MANDNSENRRGRPYEKGKSGNPSGRPLGSRNRATLAAEALLEGEAERLTRKAIDLALGGDLNALRLCLDRLVPPRRERRLELELSPLQEIHDAKSAVAEIIAGVADGSITLSEAAELGKLVDMFVRTCEAEQDARHASEKAAWGEELKREHRDRNKRLASLRA